MKRKLICLMIFFLYIFSAAALANAKPTAQYTRGQTIDVGWGDNVQFLAGCDLDDGSCFMLVDTDFNGGYLLSVDRANRQVSISGGIPVPDGWQAEITAQDGYGCKVKLSGGGESRAYTFAFAPTRINPDCWLLTDFDRQDIYSSFHVSFQLDRVQALERSCSEEKTHIAFYAFYQEANNLDHAKIPFTVADMKRLEKEYPVAAVSPSDTATRVNLRKGPSTKAERVGSLYSGTRLRIREIKDGWAKIFVGDMDAYISTEFLTFGAQIEQVPDVRPSARLKDEEWVEISRMPYRGGGGTVSRTAGGQQVRIIGEYNSQWRIVGTDGGSYFIDAENLK